MAQSVLRVAFLLLVCGGSARAHCIPGGLAVVVNKSNPIESLSMAQLRKLILGDVRVWQDHKPVFFIARDASSKAFQCALSSIVRLSVGDYHRYIINAEFRGDEPMTIQTVDSDASAARLISGSSGSFAVVEANSVAAFGPSVKVLRIDGKSVGQPGYPL